MRVPASTSDPTPAATAGQVGPMQTPARGKLQKRVDCDILHRNAPVEDLPPEVRHHLLSMLELETLWALLSTTSSICQLADAYSAVAWRQHCAALLATLVLFISPAWSTFLTRALKRKSICFFNPTRTSGIHPCIQYRAKWLMLMSLWT